MENGQKGENEKFSENPIGGQSGLIELIEKTEFWSGERDIILGKNIPDYQ